MSGKKSKSVMIVLIVFAGITFIAIVGGALYYFQLQKDIGGATLENLKD